MCSIDCGMRRPMHTLRRGQYVQVYTSSRPRSVGVRGREGVHRGWRYQIVVSHTSTKNWRTYPCIPFTCTSRRQHNGQGNSHCAATPEVTKQRRGNTPTYNICGPCFHGRCMAWRRSILNRYNLHLPLGLGTPRSTQRCPEYTPLASAHETRGGGGMNRRRLS